MVVSIHSADEIAAMIEAAVRAALQDIPNPYRDKDLLTVREVAERCNYSEDTVRGWIKNGRTLPGRVGRSETVKLKVVTKLSEGEKRYSMRIRPAMLRAFLDRFPDETI